MEAASNVGLVVVTEECPTVCLAGGYVQNGGHSALPTVFGLGSDQTLEFEVVNANGMVAKGTLSEIPTYFGS